MRFEQLVQKPRQRLGNSAVYLERKITEARHIEVQLLGDHYGTVLPFV